MVHWVASIVTTELQVVTSTQSAQQGFADGRQMARRTLPGAGALDPDALLLADDAEEGFIAAPRHFARRPGAPVGAAIPAHDAKRPMSSLLGSHHFEALPQARCSSSGM